MPPRINIFNHALAYRPRTTQILRAQPSLCRSYASDPSKDLPVAEKGEAGPNMQQAEHVSEEAAKMAKMTGGSGPDLEQGTPVQELLQEDAEAQKHAPQVLKDSIKKNAATPKPQSRPFSTYARRQQADLESSHSPDNSLDPALFSVSQPSESLSVNQQSQQVALGHKFPLPTLPLPSNAHKDYRYDPVVKQVTNLLMKDGKLSVAQANMSRILQHLRTAPAPTYNPSRPLLPGAPPAAHLPLNPILYLTLALDSVSPLLRIRSQRGAAGGGVALQIPVPLGLRQRRRQAMTWILDAASKRKSRASGKGMFATRVAEEIVAVVQGTSSAWEKRTGVHKLATTARSNLTFGKGGRR